MKRRRKFPAWTISQSETKTSHEEGGLRPHPRLLVGGATVEASPEAGRSLSAGDLADILHICYLFETNGRRRSAIENIEASEEARICSAERRPTPHFIPRRRIR